MKRMAAVAGRFYPGDRKALMDMVASMIPTGTQRVRARAVLVPHAGYIYSGAVAGAVYAAIEQPATYVLLGPNHTGLGTDISCMPEGSWETPLGTSRIDNRLASAIMREAPAISADTQAHMFEHSLEVQLPLIQHLSPVAHIVPITVMRATVDMLIEVGAALARAIRSVDYRVVVAISSDMSHFVSDGDARALDPLAIDRMLALDPAGLYETVTRKGISMCGYMPAVMGISAALALGATHAELKGYTTSAVVTGDFGRVVGYAGMIFS